MNINAAAIPGSPLAARQNPIIYISLLIAFILFCILFAIRLLLRRVKAAHSTPEWIEQQKKLPTKLSNIKAVAQKYGLSKEEQNFLYTICKDTNAANIEYFIHNEKDIDEIFRKEYELNKTLENREVLNSKLFDLRYKIERVNAASIIINSSKAIPDNTEISYVSPSGLRFPMKLTMNSDKELLLQISSAFAASPYKPKELSKADFTFRMNTGMHYRMSLRIVRYQKDSAGHNQMVLMHSENLEPLVRRGAKREECKTSCTYTAVKVKASSENKNGIEYIPLEHKYSGIVVDISKSGCQLVTSLPIKEGQYLHLELKTNRAQLDPIIGMIVSLQKGIGARQFILHISFVRISQAAQNRIQAHIYHYE